MTRTRLVATRLILVLGAMLLGANYAAAQKVAVNYDTKQDFTKYKTYKWVTITGAAYPNQLQDQMIRSAIDSALRTKGMVKQDSGDVSVYVAYQLSVTQSTQYNSYSTGGGVGYGGGWGWAGSRRSQNEAARDALLDCETRRPTYTAPCELVNVNGQWAQGQ